MRSVTLLLSALAPASALAQAVRLLPLPVHPTHGQMEAYAVSGDGRVVVGHGLSDDAGLVWEIGGALESVPAPYTRCRAYGVNGDGSVVVGITRVPDIIGYRWVRGGDFMLLEGRGGGPAVRTAACITDDGSTVFGQSRVNSAWGGVRWTDTLSVNVAGPDGAPSVQVVNSASADGSAFTGQAGTLSFLTTPVTGPILIPTLPGLSRAAFSVITSSGELVLANAFEGPGTGRDYTWNPDTGAYILPLMTGAVNTFFDAIADDGRVMVGGCNDGRAQQMHRAVVWTLGGGTEYLSDYLNRAGAALAPDDLGRAEYISRDGNVIVGSGGLYAHWVAILEPGRPADFNLDRTVDFFDLNDFLDCWEGRTRMPLSTADLNHDGFTDFFDLIEFLDRFER